MFVCGVNFRRGSPCNSNSIYIMHYHCCYNNMFVYTQAPKENVHTSLQAAKNGKGVRMVRQAW